MGDGVGQRMGSGMSVGDREGSGVGIGDSGWGWGWKWGGDGGLEWVCGMEIGVYGLGFDLGREMGLGWGWGRAGVMTVRTRIRTHNWSLSFLLHV